MGKLNLHLRTIVFMIKSRTPLCVWVSLIKYCFFVISHKNRYDSNRVSYQKIIQEKMKHSIDLFTGNISHWQRIFAKQKLDFSKPYKMLEIGSWEGLSGAYLLSTFTGAHLTCVDTWQGADEHSAVDMKKIESNFDYNLMPFQDRILKYKGKSYDFFKENNQKFDIIYVDGSHYSDDVMIDAIKCFSLLNIGGLLIFDDYIWESYKNHEDNPAMAINAFLKLKKRYVKVIYFTYAQLAITRIEDEKHEVLQVLL